MDSFKRDVVSGLVVLAPVIITLLAAVFLLRFIAGLPLVSTIDPWIIRVPIVVVVFVVVVFATGYLMRTAIGRQIASGITLAINQIPILRVIYNAVHLAIETALQGTGERSEAVRVEAWKGLRVTAFTTGKRTDDDRVVCYFPTAPNITTGYVIEVEEEDIQRTGESLEQALTRIISAGFGERESTQRPPPVDGARIVGQVHNVQLPAGISSGQRFSFFNRANHR